MMSAVLRKLGLTACVLGILGAVLSLAASAAAQRSLPQETGPGDGLPTLSAEEIAQNEEDERVLQAIMAEGIKAVPLSASPSLHNASFDNNDWYEFNERYGHYLTGTWLPDDDNNSKNNIPLSSRQDWRIWYQQGKYVLEADPEAKYVMHEEAVQLRPYGTVWNTGNQVGGIYQIVYGTTPCLEYNFSIYGQARFEPPENDYVTPPADWVNIMRAGIDRVGWALPTDDPAVDNAAFPSTTVWGNNGESQWAYRQVTVTAEALAEKITVFTYADVNGGRSSRLLWDSGALNEVTTSRIYNTDAYYATSPETSAVYNYNGNGTATVSWVTARPSISQVYYRVKTYPDLPTQPLTSTIYMPLVQTTNYSWRATTLDKSYTTSHTALLTGLEEGYVYEYYVVARGLTADNSGGPCVNWVSSKKDIDLR